MANYSLRTFSLLTILLFSFHVACSNNPVIAENHDQSIQLTESQFSDWLSKNISFQHLDRNTQIENYFIQQVLLLKRNKLQDEIIDKIDFYQKIDSYKLAKKFSKKQLINNIVITSSDLNDEFIKLKNIQNLKSNKIRLYQIYKRYPTNPTDEDKKSILKEMTNIRGRIHSLDDFKKIATTESNGQSRLRKGLIGNVKNDQFEPSLNKIIMQMQKDELSEIINLQNGLVLFYCEKIIPVKIKSDLQLKDIALKNLKSLVLKKKWDQMKKDILDLLNITIDWKAIKDNVNEHEFVIDSTFLKINIQQLNWIMQPYNSTKSLSKYTNEQISNLVNNFIINKYIFDKSATQIKNNINSELSNQYIERIILEVQIMLIQPNLSEPSQESIQKYFNDHRKDFMRPMKYNLSAIAIEFTENNRINKYKEIQSIYEDIIKNNISFDKAINLYSTIQIKYPNMELNSIARNRITKIFGMKVAKRIIYMKVGNISDILETESGYLWIIKKNKTAEPELLEFNEAKDFIKEELMNEELGKFQLKIIVNILDYQKIKINIDANEN